MACYPLLLIDNNESRLNVVVKFSGKLRCTYSYYLHRRRKIYSPIKEKEKKKTTYLLTLLESIIFLMPSTHTRIGTHTALLTYLIPSKQHVINPCFTRYAINSPSHRTTNHNNFNKTSSYKKLGTEETNTTNAHQGIHHQSHPARDSG